MSPVSNMANFPSQLRHGSGRIMQLDQSRLLLGFKRPQTRAKVAHLLEACRLGLVLEDSPGQSDNGAFLPGEHVHHTDQRFWVRTPGNTPIDQQLLNALVSRKIQAQLDWIGPVYRLPETTGRRGLLCPLPNTLVIKSTQQARVVIADSLQALTKKLSLLGLEKVQEEPSDCAFDTYQIKQPKKKSAYDLRKHLQEMEKDSVEIAEFDYMPLLDSLASNGQGTPAGRIYQQQWNLGRIEAPQGWAISRGNPDVIVAVIDRGCDLAHPSLQAAYTKTGATFLGSAIVEGEGQAVNSSHGTYCAGIIAAQWKDHCVAGLAPACKIMPLRLQTETSQELAKAIEHAARNHATVISISLADNGFDSPTVRVAIKKAADQGTVICAATGNTNGSKIAYPASDQSVIACGAFSPDNTGGDTRCDEDVWGTGYGSNFGDGLSVVAPGNKIPTTTNNDSGSADGDYTMDFWGTSAATPHVAALAALVISVYFNNRKAHSSQEVRDIIESTAVPLPHYKYDTRNPGGNPYPWNSETGYGRISVGRTLQEARKRCSGP